MGNKTRPGKKKLSNLEPFYVTSYCGQLETSGASGAIGRGTGLGTGLSFYCFQ